MITLNDGTIVTQADFDEAVQLGVQIMDEVWGVGAWREEIDLVGLRMASGKSCILGQLYWNYDDAPWEEISELYPEVTQKFTDCTKVGPFELGASFFGSDIKVVKEGYRLLTEAWYKEIYWDADGVFKTAKELAEEREAYEASRAVV